MLKNVFMSGVGKLMAYADVTKRKVNAGYSPAAVVKARLSRVFCSNS